MTADTLVLILLGLALVCAIAEIARTEAQSLTGWGLLFIVVALLLTDFAGRLS